MGDANKAWSYKDKQDFQKGMEKKPDYFGNLKRGLFGDDKDPTDKALEKRRQSVAGQ